MFAAEQIGGALSEYTLGVLVVGLARQRGLSTSLIPYHAAKSVANNAVLLFQTGLEMSRSWDYLQESASDLSISDLS
jgi:hypothetical protein